MKITDLKQDKHNYRKHIEKIASFGKISLLAPKEKKEFSL